MSSPLALRLTLGATLCLVAAHPVPLFGQDDKSVAVAADATTDVTTTDVTQPADESSAKVNADTATDEAQAGQADLDEALMKKISAKSETQLEQVAALLRSALTKGVSEEDASFAKKILGSILLKRGQAQAQTLGQLPGRQALRLRDEILKTLSEATKNDPGLVEAYLLIARLNLLPQGNKDEIQKATTKAIELLGDDPNEQSAAYTLRALTQDSDEDKLKDLDAAIAADAKNTQALQARATLRARGDDVDGAVEDLQAVLEINPTNRAAAEAAVTQLAAQDRTKEALELLSKSIEASPSEGLYRLRAILYRMEGDEDKAFADLNKALAMQPRDPVALLQRAEVFLSKGDIASAKQDLKSASALAPQVAAADQAIRVRMLIAAEEERYTDAISEMTELVSRSPANVYLQLNLANLYSADKRPRKAIEALGDALDQNPDNVELLRSRADTLLSVGDHGKAIADYETALEFVDDDSSELSGILNNLSWVLATSPKDEVRDAAKALKYGRRAAKVTDHKMPHILSTLAAAFAESGNFKKAVQWSAKAVKLSEETAADLKADLAELATKADVNPVEKRRLEARVEKEVTQLEQLRGELESYEKDEPWREKQETEENEAPILSPDDLIET